jgi:hypothetical protein
MDVLQEDQEEYADAAQDEYADEEFIDPPSPCCCLVWSAAA